MALKLLDTTFFHTQIRIKLFTQSGELMYEPRTDEQGRKTGVFNRVLGTNDKKSEMVVSEMKMYGFNLAMVKVMLGYGLEELKIGNVNLVKLTSKPVINLDEILDYTPLAEARDINAVRIVEKDGERMFEFGHMYQLEHLKKGEKTIKSPFLKQVIANNDNSGFAVAATIGLSHTNEDDINKDYNDYFDHVFKYFEEYIRLYFIYLGTLPRKFSNYITNARVNPIYDFISLILSGMASVNIPTRLSILEILMHGMKGSLMNVVTSLWGSETITTEHLSHHPLSLQYYDSNEKKYYQKNENNESFHLVLNYSNFLNMKCSVRVNWPLHGYKLSFKRTDQNRLRRSQSTHNLYRSRTELTN